MNSFPQRLTEIMRLHSIPNVAKLADALGYDRSERVRKVMTGETMPSYGMLEDIAKTFASVNLDWLITGKGEAITGTVQQDNPAVAQTALPLRPAPPAIEPIVITLGKDGKPNIVMLDSRAAAGFPANYGNPEFFQDKPVFSLPGHKFAAQGMIALQVTGDSMAPTIHHDDWLVARRLVDPATELREGYVHVLVSSDGCVAKRVFRSTIREALVCKSDNEEYPPFEHVMGAHDQLYVVLALISEDLSRRSGGVRDRLRELEKDMEVMKHKLASL